MKENRDTFTIINHKLRKKFNLSVHQYCVLETIYRLWNNEANKDSRFPGYCYASKETIGGLFGISRQTVHRIIDELIEMDLVYRDKKNGFLLQTTHKWNGEFKDKGVKIGDSLKERNLTNDSKESRHYIYKNTDKEDSGFPNGKHFSSLKKKEDKNKDDGKDMSQVDRVVSYFIKECESDLKFSPVNDAKTRGVVRTALTKISVEGAIDMVDDWFKKPLPDNELGQLTRCFSTYRINEWRAENGYMEER
jgi:hypothetical protein